MNIKYAFRCSLPVMAGYIVLGMGFGILLESKGYGVWWAFLMSVFIYAGSMQYVAVDLLSGGSYDPDGQCKASFLWNIHVCDYPSAHHYLFVQCASLCDYGNAGGVLPAGDRDFCCAPWAAGTDCLRDGGTAASVEKEYPSQHCLRNGHIYVSGAVFSAVFAVILR